MQALGDLMEECDLPRISQQKYREEFCFPIQNFYIKLGFDFKKNSFDYLCKRYSDIWGVRAHEAQLHDGIRDFLEDIGLSKTQSVLSAGIQWQIEAAAKHFDVHHLFDHVFGINDLRAASKLDRGRELIEVSKISPTKTILVGDTDHDGEVAMALGIGSLLIADGFQSLDRLAKVHNNVIPTRYS